MKKIGYSTLLFLAPILLASYFGYLWREYQLDDALIYLRYIKNFQEGHGLVYNPGERFNGLTSPFFTNSLMRDINLVFSCYSLFFSQAFRSLLVWHVNHQHSDCQF